MDSAATPAVKQSLLVRCAYYRFDEYSRDDDGHGCGYDRARMTRGPFSSPGAAKMNEKKKEKVEAFEKEQHRKKVSREARERREAAAAAAAVSVS